MNAKPKLTTVLPRSERCIALRHDDRKATPASTWLELGYCAAALEDAAAPLAGGLTASAAS